MPAGMMNLAAMIFAPADFVTCGVMLMAKFPKRSGNLK